MEVGQNRGAGLRFFGFTLEMAVTPSFSNGESQNRRPDPISCSFDRTKTAPACPLSSWLRFRIDVGAPANINARISHLAESETASLKNAHAATGAAAGRQRAAKELLSGEIPEGQTFRGTPVPDAPASLKRGRTFESRDQSLG